MFYFGVNRNNKMSRIIKISRGKQFFKNKQNNTVENVHGCYSSVFITVFIFHVNNILNKWKIKRKILRFIISDYPR